MKILVTNSKGSTGKSFVSREVLAKHMEDSIILELEGVNSSSSNFNDVSVKRFDTVSSELMDEIYEDGNIIIDAGASRIEALIEAFAEKGEMLEDEIDLILIPTDVAKGVIDDTVATIKTMNEIPELADVKKVVAFNKVQEEQHNLIADASARVKKAGGITSDDLIVSYNSAVEYLSKNNDISSAFDEISIKDLKTDRRVATSEAEKLEIVKTMELVVSIKNLSKETKFVFDKIMEMAK